MSASTVIGHTHPDQVQDHEHHDTGGTTVFGFWIYLMSDCLLFSGLFAAYAVLAGATVDGPTGKELFDLKFVLGETFRAAVFQPDLWPGHDRRAQGQQGHAAGLAVRDLPAGRRSLLGMELYEFNHLIHEGAGPGRSAFLSAFFTLVGTHGLHVTSGILWMIVLVIQVLMHGLNPKIMTRLSCLSLFWHFLDIIWIGVFTVVYLLGAL